VTTLRLIIDRQPTGCAECVDRNSSRVNITAAVNTTTTTINTSGMSLSLSGACDANYTSTSVSEGHLVATSAIIACQRRSFFFQDITHPSSSLYHLLPPPRDTSVLSRLRTATRFARPVSRTKKYCSFINCALNHYQVPPRNN